MNHAPSDLLELARKHLLRGIRLSKQGTFRRRAPEPESVPFFGQARQLLGEILESHPDSRDALLMMSQLSECILDFESALVFLNRAFRVGEPRTKKSLKRLAVLRENARAWHDFPLTPEALRHLGQHLRAKEVGPGHQTMELTREWLLANAKSDPDEVIAALARQGAYSDFQVLANVVYG